MGRVKETQRKIEKVKSSSNNHEKKKIGTLRVKMPNFDAIHKRQFKRMESISEHVERKAERAKELSKSTIKKSAVKLTTPGIQLDKESADVESSRSGCPSKARIKIDFNNIKGRQMISVPANITKKSITASESNKMINISNKENLLNKRKLDINVNTTHCDNNKSNNTVIGLKRMRPLRSFDEFENKKQKLSKSQSVTDPGDQDNKKEPSRTKNPEISLKRMRPLRSFDEFENKKQKLSKSQSVTDPGDQNNKKEPSKTKNPEISLKRMKSLRSFDQFENKKQKLSESQSVIDPENQNNKNEPSKTKNPETRLKRMRSLRSFDEFENKKQKLSKSQSVIVNDDENNKEPGSIKKIRVNRRFMLQMASLKNSQG